MSADALDSDRVPPRRFWLVRHHDGSGASGIVAEGAMWSSGQIALHWTGRPTVTSLWASLDDLITAHGYGGRTTVEWIDQSTEGHVRWVEYDGGAIWIL